MITSMMGYIKISKSPYKKYSPKAQDPSTVVPPLEVGNSAKKIGMWTLKYEISSPKFYDILIMTEFKYDTAMYLKNLYNHIMMCLNAVARLQ